MRSQKPVKAQILPSGRFRTQVVYGKDETGKNLTKSFTADTAWEAIKLAEDFKRLHVDITPTKITVREAVSAYIDSKRSVIAASTLYGYEVAAKNRLQSIQGYNITDLKIIDIQRAINIDAERGLGYKSIKSAYDLIRSAASVFEVELPSARKLRFPPKNVKEELPALDKALKVIIGSSVELPCLLAVWCGGMRISEVRGLQFGDIFEDESGRYIKVRRARVCINGHDVIENRNKTELSTRDVPLPDYIYNLIQKVPHKNEGDFIINENYGNIKARYDRLLKKHGMKMTFHDLRAQFATTMNGLGVQKEVLEKLGGWANSKVLDSVYIRTPKQRVRDSLKIFDDFMYGVIRDTRTEKTDGAA
ncbi:MAG: site-specific integrase [Ruminococcus sp.]|nr:site-specific integrase [Ruminococcus sp.]